MTTPLTGRDVVERIIADTRSRGFAWMEETIDGLKAGDLDRPVAGVAAVWMATVDSLSQAVAAGCDFVITHEPTFWNHFDAPPEPGTPTAAYEAKLRFIADHGLTIWRFHDHHHFGFERDPVLDAFFAKLGWLSSTRGSSIAAITEIDPAPLADVARIAAQVFGTEAVRVIGRPDLLIRNVGYGAHDLASCLPALEAADVVIVGEVREWDAFEYFRDVRTLGREKGLIVLSHAAVETWASPAVADWLRGLLPEVRVVPLGVAEQYAVFGLDPRTRLTAP